MSGRLLDGEDSTSESVEEESSKFDASSGTEEAPQKVDREYEKALARSESRAIFRLKIVLLFVLISVAVAVAVYAHKYAADVQEEEFYNTFQSHGTKLVSGFYEDSFQKLQAMESLSSSVTYLFRDETWPFVTIPDSANFFRPFLALSSAASIRFLPIVGDRQRLQWEEHVLNQQHWIQDAVVEDRSPTATPTDAPSSLPSIATSSQPTTSTSTEPTSMTNSSLPPSGEPKPTSDLLPTTDNNTNRRRRTQYFELDETIRISPYIKSHVGVDTSPGVWTPVWQYSPVVVDNNYYINFNQLVDEQFQLDFPILTEKKNAVIARAESYQQGLDFQSTRDLEFTQEVLRIGGYGTYEAGEPIGFLHYPVFQSSSSRDKVVAILTATVYWKSYFQNILPETAQGIICVVENEDQQFTYKIDGNDATFMGNADLHDPRYDEFEIAAEYKAFQDSDGGEDSTFNRIYTGVPVDESRLNYRIRVYPSQEMADLFLTDEPVVYAIVVAGVMLVAVLVFGVYDWYVEMRQRKVRTVALQSNAIVSSLFPKQVKDKLYGDNDTPTNSKKDAFRRTGKPGSARSLEFPEQSSPGNNGERKAAPIADFFPSATVLFMDIAGFTAWSSSREPSQVFILLETMFSTFDKLALRRRVFKVETIGDCYLAVCGLPEPCEKHALNMVAFARDCLEKTSVLAHQLIPTLGPETGELTVRIGIHSGPITAGVLRGDRARFQLFGDTVNTCSRIESTGKAGCIQCSEECSEQLRAWGKGSWLRKREDKIQAKGKGEMQTYWIMPKGAATVRSGSASTVWMDTSLDGMEEGMKEMNAAKYMLDSSLRESGRDEEDEEAETPATPHIDLYADFNYDILLKSLKAIVAKRNMSKKSASKRLTRTLSGIWQGDAPTSGNAIAASCLDEVVEFIELPGDGDQPIEEWENAAVEIPNKVKDQLQEYCRKIASMYKEDNPFHNFEHASHVTQSSAKLLSRIVSIRDSETFGLAADPLTQFAVIFSSMIHDVDHRGVPNFILAKEDPSMAVHFQHQAIAEQNSVELAWELLMEPRFAALRHTIYMDGIEQQRFRNLVVNCLLATDIFDKDLKAMRENRWHKAFHLTSDEEDLRVQSNRKATIVIEHIIQASDVSHTMQHWHVYQKWNQRLFNEMYKAFVEGRSETDPTGGWYKGELWFFDNYVIPLAKKLEECQVFGVSSDEYLLYAKANRAEWKNKGEEIVQGYADRLKQLLKYQHQEEEKSG
ncbi:unnamed protein product [Cylindrotheca closterium]|uniref:Phosphodiesterase n=1 Tax=Cylindrotheca closterium TaxID=2856 RepID=A0AAD2G691_9STRA|nr:unnamed protein product [Cylindrotheca closterium]